jgi:hypothetical protein
MYGYPTPQPIRMSTRLNPYGEDDNDLLRRFAMAEDGTAKYPAADWVESSNVVDWRDTGA